MQGKVALVTGAARGIGEAIGRMFASEGAFVWLTDLTAPDDLAVAASDPRRVRTRSMFAWRPAAADAVLARDGRLDILVDNAGVTGFEDGGLLAGSAAAPG